MTFRYLFVNGGNKFYLFSTMKTKKEIKNIKIDPSVHDTLKKYCEKRGLKIYKFLEGLIMEKCKEKKDVYGEG